MSEEDIYVLDGGSEEEILADPSSAESSEDSVYDYDFAEEDAADSASKFNRVVNIVKPELRRTSSTMSKFEMTEYVSIRATQIAKHNDCMVNVADLDDPIIMAKRELMARECPLVLRRYVGELSNARGEMEEYYELWRPAEMVFATVYPDAL